MKASQYPVKVFSIVNGPLTKDKRIFRELELRYVNAISTHFDSFKPTFSFSFLESHMKSFHNNDEKKMGKVGHLDANLFES